MKTNRRRSASLPGISLVETIVSVGVLSVVVPVVLAAILRAGDTGRSARAETRAMAIADYCMVEIRAARDDRSGYFDPIERGRDFPAGGGFMGLAFGRDGSVVGELDSAQFQEGLTELNGEEVFYVASVSGEVDDDRGYDLVTVRVAVEYPSTFAAEKRSQAVFHTRLP
ncbi:MAG: hypothetical protein AAGI48_09760 [Verrucomicrobiota bacterium]